MPDERNPYAATEVPLDVRGSQVSNAFASNEVEYGGFWRRFGAVFLDGLILLPITLLAFFGLGFSRLYYFYYFVPGLIFTAFYYMYLVMRNGATPGKRILNMRIVMVDGAPVTPKAAILRNVVEWAFGAGSTLALGLAGLSVTDAEFGPLGYLQKVQLLSAHAPKWNMLAAYGVYAWFAAGALVMLSNPKRRGVHDFLAGTVVIRTD